MTRPERKRKRPRPRVIGERQLAREAKNARLLPVVEDEALPKRPRTRGDCENGPRPCPWVACKHHLYLDVNARGHIKLNFPDLEPWELKQTCVLDVVERNCEGVTLEVAGDLMNLTRERIRQVENRNLEFIRKYHHRKLK